MIRLIEALNYRSLRRVRCPLKEFQVLVGPNGSGKSTLLDVLGFLRDLMKEGVHIAITKRATHIEELFFNREGDRFELAVEVEISEDQRKLMDNGSPWTAVRYEVAVGKHVGYGTYCILDERVAFVDEDALLPPWYLPNTVFVNANDARGYTASILRRDSTGQVDHENSVVKTQAPHVLMGFPPTRSALPGVLISSGEFKFTEWLTEYLSNSIHLLSLESNALRDPSPPGQGPDLARNGNNIPWLVEELRKTSQEQFQAWIEHVRTAIPEISDVSVHEQEERRSMYLKLKYSNGLSVPSWLVSEGTLRLIALTALPYLPGIKGVVAIEEPENCVHPMAIETIVQSLRCIYGAQALIATHSPILLSCVEPSDVLCFSRSDDGETKIISGADHPNLTRWKNSLPFSHLFASGVLG